mmetsp:Transcript_18474/g.52780  ORF Transcript_18474/g.52780 Transcript_18474/m.52780 type:complete len:98 (-) Transcript_18474:1258-1551(-)
MCLRHQRHQHQRHQQSQHTNHLSSFSSILVLITLRSAPVINEHIHSHTICSHSHVGLPSNGRHEPTSSLSSIFYSTALHRFLKTTHNIPLTRPSVHR